MVCPEWISAMEAFGAIMLNIAIFLGDGIFLLVPSPLSMDKVIG
jgi:hypothetical protein